MGLNEQRPESDISILHKYDYGVLWAGCGNGGCRFQFYISTIMVADCEPAALPA